MFSKVLIANRGIIQANCIHAVKELGARAAVLYVADERNSVGVQMADEAYELRSEEPGHEYYDEDAIVKIAREVCADAVHPGYGFLAQSASFFEKLNAAGICLIASDLDDRQKGITDKPKIKSVARSNRIQVVEGSEACATLEEVTKVSRDIGFPIVLKAICGYGGRGIRIVTKEADLPAAYEHVLSRIRSLRLPSKDVCVEGCVQNARHVEFPVLRDQVGNVVVLPELDSSIQRRFQKLIVETPSPIPDRALIRQLAGTSRRLVEKLDFVGLASVEFLVRGDDARFLEINGYVQPSHVATNQLTGIDVIKEQIRILAGERLDISQEDISPRGHAISVSINAEDPAKDFAPSPGTLARFDFLPSMGSSIYATLRGGDAVPALYASNIAQAVFLDRGRTETIGKARVALSTYIIEGIKSNLPFVRAILGSPEFEAGAMDLSYLRDPKNLKKLLEEGSSEEDEEVAALLAVVALHENPNARQTLAEAQKASNYSIWNFASRLLNRNPMEL